MLHAVLLSLALAQPGPRDQGGPPPPGVRDEVVPRHVYEDPALYREWERRMAAFRRQEAEIEQEMAQLYERRARWADDFAERTAPSPFMRRELEGFRRREQQLLDDEEDFCEREGRYDPPPPAQKKKKLTTESQRTQRRAQR